jgi:alkanesulfonate monooxygenase SsuD/methylene tetrahydromethanopterin reductase-like flavin-dependent oxidoreductase (luciferase family)
MTTFRPTRPPAGQLVRLGVVLDHRSSRERLREVAIMCDRAGIDAVWVLDHPARPPGLEILPALALAAAITTHVRLGLVVDPARHDPTVLVAALVAIDVAAGGRVEIGLGDDLPGPDGAAALRESDPAANARRLEAYVRTIRPGLSEPEAPKRAVDSTVAWAASPGEEPRLGIEAPTAHSLEVALRLADDILLPPGPIDEVVAAARRTVSACGEAGRPPQTLGLAATLPVSIGRTTAEAQARADREPYFGVIGHPARAGIFGRLEECQDRVIALAHAGITDLRCVVPNSPDVHDVIAQLTSMVVGTTRALRPDAPRSPAPSRPKEWGAHESR